MKNKKLVIFGAGETADIAYEYFTHDSTYEVVGFTVEDAYKTSDTLYGLPIISFSQIKDHFPPSSVEMFVAISYTKLNRVRAKCYNMVKEAGYTCATYISSKAFVWHNATIGENCMIFENNVIQHKVQIGNGVILWSGNHIGHQTKIHDFVYISSHVVVSGFCEIGKSSFLGVNATFNDKIKIGGDTIVGSGALITKSFLDSGKLLIGAPAKSGPVNSYITFGVQENEI
ncbi:acetyltransferase [Pinibacter soli]|uniref:Acetyltransferase n=1 Tax=Pinibacter soli TaxID=3044211 RepID=A0ABT6R7V9_9BACT|nr:acetyltransferase [Pinibacter soli]MDI3318640.1 acetyltransferase [Pinibacter soli]